MIFGNFLTHWTLVLIFLMHFIIVLVHYLFRWTRLTLYTVSVLAVEALGEFNIFHYRQNIQMFPCNELPFCAFSYNFLNGSYYYSRNTGTYIGGHFQCVAKELSFLVVRSYMSYNSWQTHQQLFLIGIHWWQLTGLGLYQLK